jgi:hypothetical protein
MEARLRAGLRRALSQAGQLPEEFAGRAPTAATARSGLR